jgi:c-di-AMP phosphodiesterase-like protein
MGFDEPATLLSKFASRKQKTVFAFVDTERFDDDGNQLYAQLSKKVGQTREHFIPASPADEP